MKQKEWNENVNLFENLIKMNQFITTLLICHFLIKIGYRQLGKKKLLKYIGKFHCKAYCLMVLQIKPISFKSNSNK